MTDTEQVLGNAHLQDYYYVTQDYARMRSSQSNAKGCIILFLARWSSVLFLVWPWIDKAAWIGLGACDDGVSGDLSEKISSRGTGALSALTDKTGHFCMLEKLKTEQV